jgi:predicted metal-dependent enzyme (double-stranded beta helix superfamily)
MLSMSLALVEPIRRAVEDDRVTSLASAVAGLVESGTFADPDLYASPRSERYTRRLVWRDPKNRFVVVAMTWAPGQSAALHDHGGVWGVEIVAGGTMCETAYTVVERDPAGGRVRFARGPERIAVKGSAGVLYPPFDHHTFGNVGTEPAHTLHVYGGAYVRLKTFAAEADGWHRESDVALEFDA